MRACVDTCVREAAWRYRTLLRTHRFVTDAELVGLFKAHVLSFVEYRTPGVYHAAASILLPLDRVLSSFLRKVGISEIDAMVHFKLAPLASRRDIAVLGVIHRAVLGEGPPQLRDLFQLDRSALRRSARHTRHGRQLALDMIMKSVLGLCHVYNLLPANIA